MHFSTLRTNELTPGEQAAYSLLQDHALAASMRQDARFRELAQQTIADGREPRDVWIARCRRGGASEQELVDWFGGVR
jgi:predicted lactoylglutathione lyase